MAEEADETRGFPPDQAPSPSGKIRSSGLAFGIEKIGLLPLRFRFWSTIVSVALVIAAAFGIDRLKVDDSLSQLFRSDSEEFRKYEESTV